MSEFQVEGGGGGASAPSCPPLRAPMCTLPIKLHLYYMRINVRFKILAIDFEHILIRHNNTIMVRKLTPSLEETSVQALI